MRNKLPVLLTFILVLGVGSCTQSSVEEQPSDEYPITVEDIEEWARGVPSFKPEDGYIPDEATAIRVAEAILSPIYGEQQIVSERPFRAGLVGDTWIVYGSLPDMNAGGEAIIKLSKSDGTVLFVTHSM